MIRKVVRSFLILKNKNPKEKVSQATFKSLESKVLIFPLFVKYHENWTLDSISYFIFIAIATLKIHYILRIHVLQRKIYNKPHYYYYFQRVFSIQKSKKENTLITIMMANKR